MQRALVASIGVAEKWMTKRKYALLGLAAFIVLRCQRRRRKQRQLKTRNDRSWVKPHIREHDQLGALVAKVTVAERVIKATCCDWLLATTNVEFARTLHNKRLTDSNFESARRLLSWSGQQHTNVLASLRPAYIRQLLGVSQQIIRLLGITQLMYARHYCELYG